MAIILKDQVDHSVGKLKSLITKFLDEHFLKRLNPYIRFNVDKEPEAATNATRTWPESEKDATIKVIMEEKAKQHAEEERIQKEERKKKEEEDAAAKAEQQALEAQKALENNNTENGAKTEKKSQEPGASAAEDDEEDEEDNDFASDYEDSDEN